MREVLHDDQGLTVAIVLESGAATVQLESDDDGPDLTVPQEVVVVVDGRGRDVEIESENRASATIVDELSDDPDPLMLMVRVHEFFEGWEIFADPEEQ